jgi:hypothetical protein
VGNPADCPTMTSLAGPNPGMVSDRVFAKCYAFQNLTPGISQVPRSCDRRQAQSTAYCLLSTACCLLSTAYCLLPTVYCLLPTAYCLLSTVYCLLSTAYCLSRTALARNPWFSNVKPKLP